jgi:hypothetical protein
MRGYRSAKEFHDNNTGLGYTPFRLKKDGDFAVVRPLQSEEEWVSLFLHADFNKGLKTTRCLSETVDKDPTTCPLCAVEAKRSLKTYIPVRVRGDNPETRVQVIEYGREALSEVFSQIEELPAGTDVTCFDFKIKRKGTGLETSYKWIAQSETKRPLDDEEKALQVPDMEETVPVDAGSAAARAQQYANSENVTPVDKSTDAADKGATSKSRF